MKNNFDMKKWKDGLFFLPTLIMGIGVLAGFFGNTPSFPKLPVIKAANESEDLPLDMERIRKARKESQKSSENEDGETYKGKGVWKDGVYVGNGTGYGGSIQVQVTIKRGKMTDIRILSHAGETPEYFAKAQSVIEKILAKQSPNVDAIAGATFSSRGIMAAVTRALIKAGDESLTVNEVAKKKTNPARRETAKNVKGKPADGVFNGSAVCRSFGYTVHLKAKFKDGKTVAVYGLRITGNTDSKNVSYWKRAWKPVVQRILSKQKAKVDAVSGATYSSDAIMEAYADAFEKAVAKNDKTSTKKKTQKDKKSDKTPSLPDSETKIPEGEVKDGTYQVSAVCRPDQDKQFSEYMLTADVTFQDKKCVSITNFSSTAEENRSFYEKAANGTKKSTGLVAQILEKQSANGLSAVSGATCSSKTIRELYLLALTKATGVEKHADSDDMATPAPTVAPTAEPSPTAAPEDSSSPSGTYKDGVYPVSTIVYPDEDEDFYEYELSADAVFENGSFMNFTNIKVSDSTNMWYCNRALEGTADQKGILVHLVLKQNASAIDAVSGATCSSDAWKELYRQAEKLAR